LVTVNHLAYLDYCLFRNGGDIKRFPGAKLEQKIPSDNPSTMASAPILKQKTNFVPCPKIRFAGNKINGDLELIRFKDLNRFQEIIRS